MRLFDEHKMLRVALLLSGILFLIFTVPSIDFEKNLLSVIPTVFSFVLILYISFFYRFPTAGNSKKIRNDVDIPVKTQSEHVRDYKRDLQEQNELFEMMLNVSTNGFWTLDVITGKVYWSSRVAEFLGVDYKSLDTSLDALKSLVMEADWDHFREVFKKSLEENTRFSEKLRLIKPPKRSDGFVVVGGYPQLNELGRPIRVIGSLGVTYDKSTIDKQKYIYEYQDALTGLYNRNFFLERLKVDIDVSEQRPDYVFAVAILDIDSFGAINDSYSSNFADNLLCVVADRIKASCRDNDCVARIGPDVFAVLLHNIQERDLSDDLLSVVRRLHSKVKTPIQLEGKEIYISVSMAVVVNNDVDCVEDIMANASAILRDLKKSGNHGGIQFFKGGIREKAMKLYQLEYEIRRAIQASEFVLVYQPIVNIFENNRVVGFEALVRWNNKEKGVISPAEFIPIAEETGLIVPMGQMILRMACIQAKKWVDLGFTDIKVAVNFSAKQFALDSMVDDVKRVLLETGLNPRNLKLEITEYTAMCEVEKAIGIMRSLSNMGLQISIDDFGTGYSSLSYLKRYPIHTLKMDKSFMDHVTDDDEDASFARMIIGVAKSLNLDIIAEGVETAEQVEFLRNEGCAQIQGYYLANSNR